MGQLWLKIKIWTKITFFSLALLYLLLFIFNNRAQELKLWLFFGTEYTAPVLIFTFGLLAMGIIGTLLVRTIWRTWRQISEMRTRGQQNKMVRELADMQTKAAMLQSKPHGTAAPTAGPPVDET